MDYAKEYKKIFDDLCKSRSAWQVWQDSITMMACAISNAVDRDRNRRIPREEEYMRCLQNTFDGKVKGPAKLYGIVINALEANPRQDFLGNMYMELGLSDNLKGQVFTPYSLCEMMSNITATPEDMLKRIDQKGWVSVSDPSCGAGATLIALANTLKKNSINYQQNTLFVGQDINRITALMCYVQLSLLGCPGYVVVGDTLKNPITCHGTPLLPAVHDGQEIWYTPFYFSKTWQFRIMCNQIDLMGRFNDNKRDRRFFVFDFTAKKEDKIYDRAE